MDAELKAKWVAALRSGNYKQGKGALRDGKKFCCLGVLGDLIDPSAWTGGGDWRETRGTLPPNACGIDSDSQGGLAEINDSGESFEEIANRIEAHL